MHWAKDGAGWICRVAPDAVFTMKVQPKGSREKPDESFKPQALKARLIFSDPTAQINSCSSQMLPATEADPANINQSKLISENFHPLARK